MIPSIVLLSIVRCAPALVTLIVLFLDAPQAKPPNALEYLVNRIRECFVKVCFAVFTAFLAWVHLVRSQNVAIVVELTIATVFRHC
jgi:hypothetical protein